MAKRCGVAGCERKFRCSGYCGLHYGRLLKHGNVNDPPPRIAQCTIDGCDRPHAARGWCAKHYYRQKKTGTLADPVPRSDIGYQSAHLRVIAKRGKAAGYPCADCGKQAHEWSYTHDDPDQRICPIGRPYSLDIDRYIPRCRSCHRQKDCNPRGKCGVTGCEVLTKAKGLCNKHYQIYLRDRRISAALDGSSTRLPLRLALLALRQSGYELKPATVRSWVSRGHITHGEGGYCIREMTCYIGKREGRDTPDRAA